MASTAIFLDATEIGWTLMLRLIKTVRDQWHKSRTYSSTVWANIITLATSHLRQTYENHVSHVLQRI